MAKRKTTKKVSVKKKADDKKEPKNITDFLVSVVRKDYGRESIMTMKKGEGNRVPALCSTGYEPLDEALGIGGLPAGRIIEIYGPEASGKTTLALHVAAEIQKLGGQVVFEDVEHALDPDYAQNIGVDIEKLILSQPDNGEQVFDITEKIIKSAYEYEVEYKKPSKPIAVIVDSVAAMTPKAMLTGELESGTGAGLGAHARLMSEGLKRLVSVMSTMKTKCVVIFINQIRTKIGVVYGNPEYTTGGSALKFYASTRIEIRPSTAYKENDEIVGKEFKAKVVKNKVAPPFKIAKGLIIFGIGIDRCWPIYNKLNDAKLIKRVPKSAWKEIEGFPKFAGYKGFRKMYEENCEKIAEVYGEVLS